MCFQPCSLNSSAMIMAKDEWSAEEELQLFHAMEGLRPVGINKHFYMSCISERLSKSLNREMPSDLIWRHLGTMYKLKELDDLEGLPFPNEEREFCLPEQDYANFVNKKTIGANVSDETAETQSSVTPAGNAGHTDSISKGIKVAAVPQKDSEKKMPVKSLDLPKRPAKRTRGSISNESVSPSTTPPPIQHSTKRRRI